VGSDSTGFEKTQCFPCRWGAYGRLLGWSTFWDRKRNGEIFEKQEPLQWKRSYAYGNCSSSVT
jgi:hypothetical protein